MGKRTPGLPRRPRSFWPTPKAAVVPLIAHLPRTARYGEPCAGDGTLIRGLSDLWPGGRCVWASDIAPSGPGIEEMDATRIGEEAGQRAAEHVTLWITNPPWPEGGKRGDPALSIIRHLITIAPAWMLLPWDFAANTYFSGVAAACSDIVPIGRVSWLGNGKGGMDNAAWYRFDAAHRRATAVWARAA